MLIWILLGWFVPAIVASIVATCIENKLGYDLTIKSLLITIVLCFLGPITVIFIIVHFFGDRIKAWFNKLGSTVIIKGRNND